MPTRLISPRAGQQQTISETVLAFHAGNEFSVHHISRRIFVERSREHASFSDFAARNDIQNRFQLRQILIAHRIPDTGKWGHLEKC